MVFDVVKGIELNIKEAKMKTRSNASPGVWLGITLPTISLVCVLRHPTSSIHNTTAVVGCGLCIQVILFLVFSGISNRLLKNGSNAGCLTSALVVSFILLTVLEQGIIFSLTSGMLTVYLYDYGFRYILKNVQNTFTVGEAMIVVQSVLLFSYSSVINIWKTFRQTPETEYEIISAIVQTGLLTVTAIIAAMSLLPRAKRTMQYALSIALAFTAVMFILLHIMLRCSPVLWILNYIIEEDYRIALIAIWVLFVGLAILSVLYQLSRNETRQGKATSSERKVFHILAVLVFVPGIVLDVPLMCLVSGVAFAVLLILEAVRKFIDGPFSNILQQSFDVYCDEKDSGGISLTPIYLLAGMCCPLVLIPEHSHKVALLSGVTSIGIGDSMASWVGSRFGRHRWRGSQRTIEGTVANVMSQLLSSFFLMYCFPMSFPADLTTVINVVLASLATGAVEAKTDQVDNLVLPLIYMLVCLMFK